MSSSQIPPTLPLLAMLALVTRWSMFALSCPISMIHGPFPILGCLEHPSVIPVSGLSDPFPSGTESHPSTRLLPSKHGRQNMRTSRLEGQTDTRRLTHLQVLTRPHAWRGVYHLADSHAPSSSWAPLHQVPWAYMYRTYSCMRLHASTANVPLPSQTMRSGFSVFPGSHYTEYSYKCHSCTPLG